MNPATSPCVRAELAIALVALIWGSTFVIVKAALADVSTPVFLALRFFLGAVLLAGFFRGRLSGPGDRATIAGGAALTGLFLFAGYFLQTAGLRFTSASKSAFLTGLFIVLVPLLGSFVKKSKPRPAEWAGAAAALAGTGLLAAPAGIASLGKGDLLTMGCALAFAAHILAVEHYSKRMNYQLLSLLQVSAVALLAGLTCFWLEPPRLVWTPRLAFALGVTAVLATAASFALYTWAQRHTTATRAALLFSLEPVFAGLTAWLAAGEAWTLTSLAGAALILGGILAVELKPARAVPHPSG
jgi:drug/metabolite transporter (DMT)-like permease